MKRKGFAVPMVLIFASILAVLGTFLIKNSRQYNSQTINNLSQLQAHYVARAGFQHAMLKVKFLERELYDAACLSQGLNPLFDFTNVSHANPVDSLNEYNPGPIFLYRSGAFSPNGLFTPSFNPACHSDIPAPPLPGYEKKDHWLLKFQEDIMSGFPDATQNYNWSMNMLPIPAAIRGLMKEPFTGQYQITELKLMARETDETAADEISNYAIVEMTMQSTINTARGENFNYIMKKTIKVTRDNES